MANKIQVRRGTGSVPTLDTGEPAFATDTKRLYVGHPDGNVPIAANVYVDTNGDLIWSGNGKTIKIAAAGTYTLTIPATGTAALLGTAQTFSAAQTFSGVLTAPGMKPASDSTTAVQIQDAGGTAVLTIDTVSSSGAIKNLSVGGRIVRPQSMYYPIGAPRVLNLASTDADLKGFIGGFTDGRYGYFVPHNNGARFGKVARVDLSDFSTVSVLNLASTDADLKGFQGGFTDGRYGYFVPHNNGAFFGKVARVDLSDFSTVSVLNLASTDADLKGFIGGFTDGRYGYFVPYNNGAAFGKVARIQMFNGGVL